LAGAQRQVLVGAILALTTKKREDFFHDTYSKEKGDVIPRKDRMRESNSYSAHRPWWNITSLRFELREKNKKLP